MYCNNLPNYIRNDVQTIFFLNFLQFQTQNFYFFLYFHLSLALKLESLLILRALFSIFHEQFFGEWVEILDDAVLIFILLLWIDVCRLKYFYELNQIFLIIWWQTVFHDKIFDDFEWLRNWLRLFALNYSLHNKFSRVLDNCIYILCQDFFKFS